MSDKLVIPEDLQTQYRVFSTGKNVRPTSREYVSLIERISRQNAVIEKLQKALEELHYQTTFVLPYIHFGEAWLPDTV